MLWVDLSKNSGLMSVVNFLVVFGELDIGVSLILGLLTRFGAAMGTLMMLLFFVAARDWAFGIVNQHLAYAVVTFGLAAWGWQLLGGRSRGTDGQPPAFGAGSCRAIPSRR